MIWNAKSGEVLRALKGAKQAMSPQVAFSPDDKLFPCSAGDGLLRVWDIATGKLTGEYPGPVTSVHQMAFAPDAGSNLYPSTRGFRLGMQDGAESHDCSYAGLAGRYFVLTRRKRDFGGIARPLPDRLGRQTRRRNTEVLVSRGGASSRTTGHYWVIS